MKKKLALVLVFLMIFTNLFGFAGVVDPALQVQELKPLPLREITIYTGDLTAEVELYLVGKDDAPVATETAEDGKAVFHQVDGHYYALLHVTTEGDQVVYPLLKPDECYQYDGIDINGERNEAYDYYLVHELTVEGNYATKFTPSEYTLTLGTDTLDPTKENYIVAGNHKVNMQQIFKGGKVADVVTRDIAAQSEFTSLEKKVLEHTVTFDAYTVTIPWTYGDVNRNFALYQGFDPTIQTVEFKNVNEIKSYKGFLSLQKTDTSKPIADIVFTLLEGDYTVWFAQLDKAEKSYYDLKTLKADQTLYSELTVNTLGVKDVDIDVRTVATEAVVADPIETDNSVFELSHSKYVVTLSKAGITKVFNQFVVGGDTETIKAPVVEATFDFGSHMKGLELTVESVLGDAPSQTFTTVQQGNAEKLIVPLFADQNYRYTLKKDGVTVSAPFEMSAVSKTIDLTKHFAEIKVDFKGIANATIVLRHVNDIDGIKLEVPLFDAPVGIWVLNANTYTPTIMHGGYDFAYDDIVLSGADLTASLEGAIGNVTLSYEGISDVDVLITGPDKTVLESFYAKTATDDEVSFNVIVVSNEGAAEPWYYNVVLNKNGIIYEFQIEPTVGVQIWDNLTRGVSVDFNEFVEIPVDAQIQVGNQVFANAPTLTEGKALFRVFREFSYFISLTSNGQHKATDAVTIPADSEKSDGHLEAVALGDYSGLIQLNHVGATFDKIELLDDKGVVLSAVVPSADGKTPIPVFKALDLQVRLTKGTATKTFPVTTTDGIQEFYVGYAELFYKNEGVSGANFRYSFDNGGTWSTPIVKTTNGHALFAIAKSELPKTPEGVNTSVKFELNLNETIVNKVYDLSLNTVIKESVYKLTTKLMENETAISDLAATIKYFRNNEPKSFNSGNLQNGLHELYVLSGKYMAELSYRDGVNQLTGNKNEDIAFNFKLIPVTVRVNGANGFDSVKYYKNTDKSHYLTFGSDTDASSTLGLLADTYDFSVGYATSSFFSPGFAVTETNNLVEFDVKDLTVNFTDSKGNPITEGTVSVHSLGTDGVTNSDGVLFGTFTPENKGVITKALEQGKTYQFTLRYQKQEMIIQKAFPLDVPTDEVDSIQSLSAASTAPFVTFTTMDYRVKFEDSKHKPYVGVEVVVQNKAMMEATTADVAAPFPKKAMTDAQGIAHFELLQGGYDVILSYEGGVQTKTARLDRNVFLGRQTIAVTAPHDMLFQTVEATVAFNESTGAPIKDAPVYQIQMKFPMPGTPMKGDGVDLVEVEKGFADDDMITLVGKTGADGKLLIERLPQNTYMMSVERYGVLSFEKPLHVMLPTELIIEGMDGLANVLPIDITPINTVKFSTLPVVVEVYGSVLSSGAPIQGAKVEFATSRLLKKKEMKEVSVTEAPVTDAPLQVFYTGQNTNAEGKTYLELLPNFKAFGYMVKVTYNGTWDMDRLFMMETRPPSGILFADGPIPPTPGRMNTITFRTTGIEVISKYTDNVGISGTQITVTDAKVPVGSTVNGRKIVEVFMPLLEKAPVFKEKSSVALEEAALMPSMMIYATQAGVEKSLAYNFPEVQQAVFTFDRPVVNTNDNERPARVTTETIIDVPAPLGPVQFIDVPGHWAEKEINALAELGYVKGKTPTMFYPNAPITRAEFGSILARILKLTGTKQTHFVDVPGNAWFFDSIASAYEFGVVKGISPTQYGPYLNITRQDIALMVVRAYSLKTGKSMEVSVNELFKDDPQIGSYAKEAVYQAKGTSIVGGYPDGNFRPQGNATRAEAAKMLKILMDAIAGK